VGSLEVVDLDLDAARVELAEPADELDADRAAVLLEPQPADVIRAHEPEVAVDVADRDPEQEPHRGRVYGSDDAPVERVGAVALVALDPVDLVGDVLSEPHELLGVVLTIAVGVEDPVAASLRQRRAQCAAVAAVRGVLDHPQARLARARLAQPLKRRVGRAVVHDDDLPLRAELVERLARARHQARDRLGVVVTEQAGRDRGLGAQARAAQTRSTSSSVSSG